MKLQTLTDFLKATAAISVETGLRYFFFAGLAWLLGYVLFRKRWQFRKIIERQPVKADVWREVRWSMVTLVVYGLVGVGTIWMVRRGWTHMYYKIGERGWGWFCASIVLTIFLHDAWFYWTHRAMHHPRLFRWVHKVHHLSTNPTPWAAYAFSPIEAVVQAMIFPLAVLLMPIHPLAFFVFMIWQITNNVVGHSGYEIWPRWYLDTRIGRFMNTPTNHILHHEYFRGNYGLYFNFWDRLMGTNHEKYEARFKEVTGRERVTMVTDNR